MNRILRTMIRGSYNLLTLQKTISRDEFLAQIPRSGLLLEIGPFTNPDLRGPSVYYFDVLDKAGLLARAEVEAYPIKDPGQVPEINYVSSTGDLSIISEKFNAIYSSHCIEHQPDLIEHLTQIERLLKPDGRYYITVPDKRYCFDALIAKSDLAEVIQAQGQRRHSLTNVIRHCALTTHNSPFRHWISLRGKQSKVASRTRHALTTFNSAQNSYIDVHAWRFTPNSLRELVINLGELGYTGLVVEHVYSTSFGAIEFYIVLRKAQ